MNLVIKKSILSFPISFSFFGLFLVIDQLLLPMFHFRGMPFKVSYFLAALWFINFLVVRNQNIAEKKDFWYFFGLVSLIMICGFLGEFFFIGHYNSAGFEPLVRSILTYILMIFSFGLGLSAPKFNLNWLIPILFIAIFLNFIFIFFKSQVPVWLINIYYSSAYVDDFAGLGITSVEDILELTRPRGLFPNPNGSAFMVNIISLFLYLGIKKKICIPPSALTYSLIIILPIILCMLLASRGEFVVSLILGFLHTNLIFKSNKKKFFKIGSVALFGIIISVSYVAKKIDLEEFQHNINRALSIVEVLNNTNSENADEDEKALASIARPLLVFVPAYERFKISPIFGTGFAKIPNNKYFNEGTDYYHNDWFRLLVTSGIVGLLCMLLILYRYVLPLGWPTLIPFVLPAMVNTFLLNINAVMFFFFMIAVINTKLRNNED